VTGHGFEVTGDPADLPPGTKAVALNINGAVEAVGRALHREIIEHTREGKPWEQEPAMVKHNFMELGLAAVMALVEEGWHSADMHAAIRAAMAEDEDNPATGMDPR